MYINNHPQYTTAKAQKMLLSAIEQREALRLQNRPTISKKGTCLHQPCNQHISLIAHPLKLQATNNTGSSSVRRNITKSQRKEKAKRSLLDRSHPTPKPSNDAAATGPKDTSQEGNPLRQGRSRRQRQDDVSDHTQYVRLRRPPISPPSSHFHAASALQTGSEDTSKQVTTQGGRWKKW